MYRVLYKGAKQRRSAHSWLMEVVLNSGLQNLPTFSQPGRVRLLARPSQEGHQGRRVPACARVCWPGGILRKHSHSLLWRLARHPQCQWQCSAVGAPVTSFRPGTPGLPCTFTLQLGSHLQETGSGHGETLAPRSTHSTLNITLSLLPLSATHTLYFHKLKSDNMVVGTCRHFSMIMDNNS